MNNHYKGVAMKNKILTLSLCVASLTMAGTGVALAQTENHHSSWDYSNWDTKSWTKQDTAASPQNWDGTTRPGSYPRGDNPKWYQSSAPSNGYWHNKYHHTKTAIKKDWHKAENKTVEEKDKFEADHPKISHPIDTMKEDVDKNKTDSQ
jgi:hypothetical protein